MQLEDLATFISENIFEVFHLKFSSEEKFHMSNFFFMIPCKYNVIHIHDKDCNFTFFQSASQIRCRPVNIECNHPSLTPL